MPAIHVEVTQPSTSLRVHALGDFMATQTFSTIDRRFEEDRVNEVGSCKSTSRRKTDARRLYCAFGPR